MMTRPEPVDNSAITIQSDRVDLNKNQDQLADLKDENRPGFQIKDQSINWQLNESLLQSYRGIFITSQSLLVGAVAFTKEPWLNMVIIIMALILLRIGFTVIRARARVVDFYKFNLCRYKYKGIEITKEKYVTEKVIRDEANHDIVTDKTNWRPTRVKVDLWIPRIFFLIWLSFLIKVIIDLFSD